MKLSTLFCLFGVTFSMILAAQSTPSNKRNKKDDLTISLPNIDTKNLSPEDQKVVKELRSFAARYLDRAEYVKHMRGSRKAKAKAVQQFDADFQKEIKSLQRKVKTMKRKPMKRNGDFLYTDGSLMGKLNDFLKSVNELPVRVHCLIQDCSGLIVTTMPNITLPTLSTSSPETTTEVFTTEPEPLPGED